MNVILKNQSIKKLLINALALIFGYSFWFMISSKQNINYKFHIPIVFSEHNFSKYNFKKDSLLVELNFNRHDFEKIKKDAFLFVDVDKINIETGNYLVDNQSFILPNSVKLIKYNLENINFFKNN